MKASYRLTEVLRDGAGALLTQAVVSEFLAATADLKTDDGCRRVVRHGHLPSAPPNRLGAFMVALRLEKASLLPPPGLKGRQAMIDFERFLEDNLDTAHHGGPQPRVFLPPDRPNGRPAGPSCKSRLYPEGRGRKVPRPRQSQLWASAVTLSTHV